MVDHKIAACTKDGIWLLGTVDDYIFEAKVCDEASSFGIDCGRVIKLHARKYCEDKKGKEIFAYERGWDKYPRGKHKGVAQALIRFLESLPEQDIWRHTFYKKVRRFLVTEDDVLEYDENGNPC